VVEFANVDASPARGGTGRLRVTTQAKVGITLGEQFAVHRSVRVVTGDAAFPQGWMLEDERAGLRPMTLRAALVEPGHGQSARWFEDVAPVRIVALNAIHPAFHQRMMVRGLEFAPHFQVALQAGLRIFAGVNDELGSAARRNVFAAGSVTRFTPGIALLAQTGQMDAGMGAGRKALNNGRVTIQASFVADFMGAGHDQRRVNRPTVSGTRIEQQSHRACAQGQRQRDQPPRVLHFGYYGFG
jgi:hypothetical protein